MKPLQMSTFDYILPFSFRGYFQCLESRLVVGGFLATLQGAFESWIQIIAEMQIGNN